MSRAPSMTPDAVRKRAERADKKSGAADARRRERSLATSCELLIGESGKLRRKVLALVSLLSERRKKIGTHLRLAVLERDGLVCRICCRPVEPNDVHLDHILAVSRGGRNTLDNLRVTHSRCNLRKGPR